MPDPAQTSRQLLEIALKTYRSEILEELEGSKRYVGAMVANAIDIAARGLTEDDPATQLAGLLENGADAAALAAAIRSGAVSDETHAGLRDALRAYVRARLQISNPRFLTRRET